jgi:hypothetical protein
MTESELTFPIKYVPGNLYRMHAIITIGSSREEVYVQTLIMITRKPRTMHGFHVSCPQYLRNHMLHATRMTGMILTISPKPAYSGAMRTFRNAPAANETAKRL